MGDSTASEGRSALPEWAIGEMLAVLGCLTSSAGLFFMKDSADLEAQLPLLKRWRWACGFGCLLFNGLVLDPASFSLAPLSMIAPVGGLVMIFSCLLACAFRGERLTPRDLGCIALVLGGVTTVSYFGPHPEGEPPLETLVSFIHEPPFLRFVAFCVTAVIAELVLIHRVIHCAWVESACVAAARLSCGCSSAATTLLAAYAAASSGCLTQLCLKVAATAAREALETHSAAPLLRAAVAPAVVGLVCFATLQLYLLHTALGGSPVKYAVPAYQGCLILLSSSAGGILFREFQNDTTVELLGFFAGLLLAIGGVIALSLGRRDTAAVEAQADEEEKVSPGAYGGRTYTKLNK